MAELLYINSSGASSYGAQSWLGQSITPDADWLVDSVWIDQMYTSKGGGGYCRIYLDGGSGPTGASLGQSGTETIATSPGGAETFTFASPVALSNGVKYWFVFTRPGGTISLFRTDKTQYAGGNLGVYNGGDPTAGWTENVSWDARQFKVNGNLAITTSTSTTTSTTSTSTSTTTSTTTTTTTTLPVELWDDIYYYRSTQAIANRLQDWTRGQNEKYSNIQQLLQTTGKELEATIESMRRASNSLFLRSMDMRSIDLTYQIELPYSFEFEFDFTDPTNPRPKPPEVQGIIDGNIYDIEAVFENDISSFWYEPIGNRISLGPDEIVHEVGDVSKLTAGDVLPATDINVGKLVATYTEPLIPGRLYVTIAAGDATKYGFKNNRVNMPGYVELRGTTVKGSEETERLAFAFDSTLLTRKYWREISDVLIYNITPEDAQITITSAAGTLQQSPDPGFIDYDTVGPKVTFWEIAETNLQAVLQQISTVSRVVTSEVSIGFQLDVFREWSLINATGFAMPFATVVDYAFEVYRPYMYVLTDDGLVQVFNKLPEYPDLDSIRLLKQRTDGTKTVIQANYDEGLQGDEIRLSAKTLTKTKPVAFYYLQGAMPHHDGTLRYIGTDGTWGSTLAEARVSLTTPSVNIPYKPYLIDLDEVGCYTFLLTTRYLDGTEDKDVKIIWSRYKMPLASFDLMAADPTLTTPLAICFDYNHRLWVGGMYGSEFKFKVLNLHADLMLIDYDKKLLYLREEYGRVWVGENDATTSTTSTSTTTSTTTTTTTTLWWVEKTDDTFWEDAGEVETMLWNVSGWWWPSSGGGAGGIQPISTWANGYRPVAMRMTTNESMGMTIKDTNGDTIGGYGASYTSGTLLPLTFGSYDIGEIYMNGAGLSSTFEMSLIEFQESA